MELKTFFECHPRLALAFSGGADSAYLLYAGQKWAQKLGVYYVHSTFQPAFERRDAERLAKELGVGMQILEADVLGCPEITANPPDRCYHCKQVIMSTIRRQAALDGFDTVIDGTNASDDIGDRPGYKALGEQGVLSPLRLCGITKAEVRRLSRDAGLFTWDKPAYACLATRVRTGEEITREKLEAIEKSEDILFEMGFSDFRVRTAGDEAKLQFVAGQQPAARAREEEIRAVLSRYFGKIIIDPNEREASV